MTVVYNYKKFQISKISLSSPHINKNGSKTINIFYPNNEEWYFQTTLSKIPFNPYSSSFCISLDEKTESKIVELEKMILEKALEESYSWFDAIYDVDKIEDLFTPCITQSRSPEYPPFMKVLFNDSSEFYDESGKILNKESIEKDKEVKLIIKFKSIYINQPSKGERSQKFKIISELQQACIYTPKEKKIEGYAFIDDSEDELA